ncbi:MAG TPA: glycoside hydrolase family 2 TIM barrel-domain containing protein [Spirillospora sp.]|nr:glycoside hydrolase family 2 TIM barrel-domain containing protein [Spirillospora sp.]
MKPATDRPAESSWHVRLEGDWQVCPVAADDARLPDALFAEHQEQLVSVPDSSHLQPVLYPDQPYWGEHLRAINQRHWLYRRSFDAPGAPVQRVRLRFGGVDYFAEVWLNGCFLGRHEGHFAPFEYDVTDLIQPGRENILFVRVSSPWDAPNPNGTYPLDHVRRGLVKGLYEHGEGVIPPDVNPIGIWRPVWLVYDQGISIDGLHVRTRTDGTVRLRITATNATGQVWDGVCDLDVQADNHDGPGLVRALPVHLPPGRHDLTVSFQIPDPRLWWPWDHGQPHLYRLTATLAAAAGPILSVAETTFGVRSVYLDRSPDRFTCYINDRPVFLRGTAYIPALYLSAITRDRLSDDLELARNANLNLLRAHVHVSVPDFYDLCDRMGILVWQDFELNWVHESSLSFEHRARRLQREMIDLLGNHPSIIAWSCHNEPTMRIARRRNLEQHPDPALYADAVAQDPTRMIFLCSGHLEDDWRRSGDTHTYYGAIWSRSYTDVYAHHLRLNTEFGFEAPAARSTLQAYPEVWKRLQHLEHQIDYLWQYQAELIKFHVEHLRRLRATCSAGYIHFWLVDLVPQVGCGVIDAHRQPKAGYDALRLASQPLHIALEHDGRRPYAIWIFNDLCQTFAGAIVSWQVFDRHDHPVLEGQTPFDVAANSTQRVVSASWNLPPEKCARVVLTLKNTEGDLLASNVYEHPFQPLQRPAGYPWKFDPYLGIKVFDFPDAPSLADVGSPAPLRIIPLVLRERLTEYVLRQQIPFWLASGVARIIDRF